MRLIYPNFTCLENLKRIPLLSQWLISDRPLLYSKCLCSLCICERCSFPSLPGCGFSCLSDGLSQGVRSTASGHDLYRLSTFSLRRGSAQRPCRALQPSFLWLYFWILMDAWILTHTYTRNGYLAFFPRTMLRQNVLQISVPGDFPLPGKKFPT